METKKETNVEESNMSNLPQKSNNKLFRDKKTTFIAISLALIFFCSSCALGMISPFFPRKASEKGCSKTTIGLIFSVHPLVIFLFSPIVGKMIPYIGPKFCLIGGCTVEGASLILFGFAIHLPNGIPFILFCFCIRIITALGSACTLTASLTFTATLFKDNLNTVNGIVESSFGAGFMAGPAIGGILYKVGGFTLPFLVLGLCVICLIFSLIFILPSSKELQDDCSHHHDVTESSLIKVLLVPGVLIMTSVNIMIGIANTFFDTTLANHINSITNNTLSVMQIGFFFLIPSGFYTFSAPIVGVVADKLNAGRSFMVIGSFLCFAGYMFIGPSPLVRYVVPAHLWVVCISLAVIGITVSLCFVPVISHMQESAIDAGFEDNLVTASLVSGIWNGSLSIGNTVGPTFAGIFTDHFGFPWASTVIAFLFLAEGTGLVIYTAWNRRKRLNIDNSGYKPLKETHKELEEEIEDYNDLHNKTES
ncbi:MFS-type transporter SLC18B1-like [Hydractinia symbiolongicarpus]|uniref:MFS-type transporter SLC18B1-like n=1 Tax=Hydractinia symbiolongicarpus TaxID=13093 RepID=UPI00254CC453|nr:MFS-type transporter SLC18B1-like [Hydractinia symbiolongicarpus]XP_057300993.1 MFS-type transporter SLC18B1-like [Hydractinia symbiolongicarpus]XP_057300994.1 MFS-type transporter SLC18B1-like [Hydractinia symbiolongicarpus]